jgi:hypothetical protein
LQRDQALYIAMLVGVAALAAAAGRPDVSLADQGMSLPDRGLSPPAGAGTPPLPAGPAPDLAFAFTSQVVGYIEPCG